MNIDEIFKRDYARLNAKQKEAVDTIDGPVMVIAGPGTGKTSILTLRIANILQRTDTSPENILALTFTESGAYAMRKKLVGIIGTAGYKVNINTFHGFCNEVIKQYPERFPGIIGSTAITDIERIELMEKIIESKDVGDKLEKLKPYGDVFFYVRPALGEIQVLKRENIGVEDFAKMIKHQEDEFESIPDKVHEKGAHKGKMKGEFSKMQERIQKNKELLTLFSAYQAALVKQKLYDFEDMLMVVIETLKKDEDLLLRLQESYQYVLADEHQDTNNAQNEILKLLVSFHDNPNLFIVGDEKQAIFRFQGASLDNFYYFQKLYPNAVTINLEENYRSTQPILNASHTLISKNILPEGHQRVELISKAETGKEPVYVREFISIDSEYAFIVSDIKEKIKAGVNPDEIAILYRDNKDAFPIGHVLERTDIPFRIESDNDILKDSNIRKLLSILESVNNLTDEEKLGKVLFIDFLGINAIDVYKAFDAVRKEKKPLVDVVSERFPELSAKLSSWATYARNKTFVELFEIIVRESGYLEYALAASDSLEQMGTLGAFFTELQKMAGARKEYFLTNFIDHLTRVREHGILTKTGKSSSAALGVRLMTAHKSKGLEFDYVYIVGAFDGHWGNKTKRTYFHTMGATAGSTDNTIDDERRLFYVALTRARKLVTITYARQGTDGRDQLPAQFIAEIADEFKKVQVSQDVANPATLFKEAVLHEHHEITNKEYLQQLFLEQGLSVTALNNYLKCPWEYFFNNLVRLPQAKSKHQMYGTAVHETLKTFFDKYRDDEPMSLKSLLQLFEVNLGKTLMPPKDYTDSLKKGNNALKGYFEAYNGKNATTKWNQNLLTEYSIRGVHLAVPAGKGSAGFDLLLKGQLDKIEMLNDREVNVVDYKTGAPKSRNELEGNTKNADGNYHRQLIFYKLLLDLDEKKKYVMKTGELDFIEPDTKGNYHKERFEISDEQVAKLTLLVTEKAREIHELGFWDTSCDDPKCEYCALSKEIKL